MLARCSRCDSTFVTNRFGRQRCPKCQGEVFVEDPMHPELTESAAAYAPPSGAPSSNDAPIFAAGEPIPWERRQELGFVKALAQTVKLALTEPKAFFSHMKYDHIEGAHLYFFLVMVAPCMLATVLARVFAPSIQEQLKQWDESIKMIHSFYGSSMDQFLHSGRQFIADSNSWASFFYGLFRIPFFSFAGLYLMAGVTHLVLLVLKKAGGGWNATLKAYVYACSPGIFLAIPLVQGPLAVLGVFAWLMVGSWATVLQIIGISKGHKTTTGYATAGVLSFHVVAMCGICAVASVLGAVLFPQLAHLS